jgi:hypothetical protein
LYHEAIDRLSRTRLGRSSLERICCTGEWLRTRGPTPRRAQAAAYRARHASSHRDGSVRRARRRELLATGEKAA